MCEYNSACTKRTDPLAKALSENPREHDADLLVLCPKQLHLLGAVYDLRDGRGRVLCTPHHKFRHGSMYKPSATLNPNEIGHFHPSLEPLALLDLDDIEYGRCRCGTWSYRARSIVDTLAAHDEGRVLPSGELVKVKHASGRVTKMGRSWAERNGMVIVGTVATNAKLSRPYVMGSWVGMADRPAASDEKDT